MSGDPEQDQPAREPGRECARCGAPLGQGQDWCLSCGTGTPEALSSGAPGWRTAGAIASAVAVLLAGTAVAAYAALNEPGAPAPAGPTPLAQVPPTGAPGTAAQPLPTGPTGPTGPTATAPPAPAPPAGASPAPPPKTKPAQPKPAKSKPVQPNPPPAPTASETHPGATSAPATTATEHTHEPPRTGSGTGEPAPGKPGALLLDTNAASTYNPCRYPASSFGEPYLATDGEPTTAWHAVIEPGAHPEGPPVAPGVEPGKTHTPTGPTGPTAKAAAVTGAGSLTTRTPAELCEAHANGAGLAINLVTPQRLATLTLDTSTPGMTAAVYGTNAAELSSSTAWTTLAQPRQITQHGVTITLPSAEDSYRFVLVWISKARAGASGSAAGRVKVNEVELFPPSAG